MPGLRGQLGFYLQQAKLHSKSNCGVEINLDQIHLGDKLIKDYEIMLSETQERMLFVVEETKIREIVIILKKYELNTPYSVKLLKKNKYLVKRTTAKFLADLPFELLVTPPKLN